MDGFKPMVKMKTGGSVSKAVEEAKMCSGGKAKYKEGGKVHDDEAQDKALIKKELGKFAKAEDKGEKTELKLKSGGRAKKAAGSVKKFKSGGAIEMKKSSGDLDTIKKVKATGAKKAEAPSKAVVKSKDVKKFAAGGMAPTSPIPPAIASQIMGSQRLGGVSNPPAVSGTPVIGQTFPSTPGNNPVINGTPVMGGSPAPFPGTPMGTGVQGGPQGGYNPSPIGGINQILQHPEIQKIISAFGGQNAR